MCQKKFWININFNNDRLDVLDNEHRSSIVARQMGLPKKIFRTFRVVIANRVWSCSRCVHRMYVCPWRSKLAFLPITTLRYSRFRIESFADRTTDGTKKPEEISQLAAETEKPQPIALFLLLDDTRALGSDVMPGLSPCWDHIIHIVQSRSIPLDPKDVSLAMRCVDKHKEEIKFKGGREGGGRNRKKFQIARKSKTRIKRVGKILQVLEYLLNISKTF